MFRPDFIGRKSLYLNPSSDKLTTANIAAIDTAFSDVISPYAYTATVRDDYDSFNFLFSDAGSDLVAGQRLAVGLFLSPQNEQGNLLFQLSGALKLVRSGTITTTSQFFFGRKATNNTVVSDKTAPQNTLASFMYLPSNKLNSGVLSTPVHDSIETEVFSLNLAGGYVYCFGLLLDNVSAVTTDTLKGGVSLSMRKYSSEIEVFRPSR